MIAYNGFTKAKKTQVKQIVIAAKTVDMRIKWNSEVQEYECNIKFENDSRYSSSWSYFTNDWQDAAKSVESMAYDMVALAVGTGV